MTRSLRTTLLIATFLVTLVAWGLAALLSYRDIQIEVRNLFDAHLAESARALLLQAGHEDRELRQSGRERRKGNSRKHDHDDDDGSDDKDDDDDDDDENSDDRRSITEIRSRGHLFEKHLVFQIWDDNQNLIVSSRRDLGLAFDAPAAEGFSDVSSPAGDLRVFSEWNSSRTLRAVVAESVEARRSVATGAVRNVLRPLLWMIAPLLILLVLVVEIALRPVRRLSREISRRSPDDLSPVPAEGLPAEVRPTIESLNRLFARVVRTMENERRFTADAAHELRTPLAAVKVQAQVAMREPDDGLRNKALEAVVKGVDRATHLVGQLLTLARLDPETSVPADKIPLRALATEVIQGTAPEAVSRSVELELCEGPECEVAGSRAMLAIMVRNLVDNAVRYTPAGGAVRVKVGRRAGVVSLTVEDNGPGLTADQIKQAGERFSRLTRPSGEGSGLGLSIVQRIATLHRASVRMENKSDKDPGGRGLVVVVEFPDVRPED